MEPTITTDGPTVTASAPRKALMSGTPGNLATSPSPAATPASRRSRLRGPSVISLLIFARDRGITILWLLMVLCFSVWAAPAFGTFGNATLILGAAALTSIFAAGVAFGVLCGFIDISVPGTAAFAGVLTGLLVVNGLPVWIALAAGVASGAAVGLLNAALVLRGLNSLVATIGTLSVMTGLASVLSSGVPVDGLAALHFIGTDTYGQIPAPAFVALGIFVVGTVFLTQTRGGVRMVAVGGNPEAVRRSGVSIGRYVVLSFMLVGMCSATGGIVTAAVITSATPSVMPSVLFDALTAVALSGMALSGGRGSFPRVLVGALIIATITSALVIKNVQPYWSVVISGVLLIGALAIERLLKNLIANRLVAQKDTIRTPRKGNPS